jgi:spermidine synthase
MTQGRRAIVVLYTLSGAAGLVYEVAWTRLLTLELGHTVAAASTVLAAFMSGLAAGAWAAGTRPLRGARWSLQTYAALEAVVALAALLLPVALHAAVPALTATYADGDTTARFAVVRIAISFVLVGIPAAAMGATFPILAGAVTSAPAEAGVLYAANTCGAAVGAIAAGFWLVPAFGLRATTWAGVALNALAAGGAIRIASTTLIPATGEDACAERAGAVRTDASQAHGSPGSRSSKVSRSPRGAESLRRTGRGPRIGERRMYRSAGLAALAAGVSGFAALNYEVAWTRLIALVVGPTTYAFATMAASFITGIAIGSAVGTRIARRTDRAAAWLGVSLIAGGLGATTSAWYAATAMPLTVAAQVADPTVELASIVSRQALTVGLLLLPTTFVLGASFPFALALAGGRESSVVHETARVYTANTVGAIAGALVGGFVLVPTLGLRVTIRDAALLAALVGAGVILRERFGRAAANQTANEGPASTYQRPVTFVTAAIAIAAVGGMALTPPWDRALLASGAYKYAPYIGEADLDAVLRAGTIVYYKEGASGTVSVRDLNGTRSLAIDGKVDASNAGDMLTQRLLGLLPVLIHGDAQEIAIIGLGSGVTAASALAAGTVRRADVIEISPEVVDASRYFEKENGRVLDRPGVRVIVGDGRTHLLLTHQRYDVIVSEPSNPWMAGVATLFTREFFQAAKATLKPHGLLCQWAHTYDIRLDDLKSIVGTFASVFPQGSMWLVGGGDLLLIGSADGEIASRLSAVATGARRRAVDAVLNDVGVTPGTAAFALLSLYAGGPAELARFSANSVIQTDDHLPLEYSAPRGIYGRTGEDNAHALRTLAPQLPAAVRTAVDGADAEAWASRGAMDLRAQAFTSAYDAFREAVARNSRNIGALAGLSDAAGGANRLSEEREWLEATASRERDNAAVRIELSRVRAVLGDGRAAVEAAQEALRLTPDDPRAAEQLASVFADLSDGERLSSLSDAMMARFPDRTDSTYYRATALFLSGKTEDAAALARRLVDAHPEHARAQGLLGAACAALGRRECAKAAFDASIRGNPRDPSGYINAGAFQLQMANPSSAADYFANALAIDPTSSAARNGLAQARVQLARR